MQLRAHKCQCGAETGTFIYFFINFFFLVMSQHSWQLLSVAFKYELKKLPNENSFWTLKWQ